jgi:hypothetical protein
LKSSNSIFEKCCRRNLQHFFQILCPVKSVRPLIVSFTANPVRFTAGTLTVKFTAGPVRFTVGPLPVIFTVVRFTICSLSNLHVYVSIFLYRYIHIYTCAVQGYHILVCMSSISLHTFNYQYFTFEIKMKIFRKITSILNIHIKKKYL